MVKYPPAMRETWVRSLGGRIPWRTAWQPTPGFLPGESHGQRSVVGYSPWVHRESDATEQLSMHAYTSINNKDTKVMDVPVMRAGKRLFW